MNGFTLKAESAVSAAPIVFNFTGKGFEILESIESEFFKFLTV